MKIDFNKLKCDISLVDFLLNDGWRFAPGTSPAAPKLTDGSRTFVIKKNTAGQYTYWDVHSSDVRGKTIIDYLQEKITRESGSSPSIYQVGSILQKYLSDGIIVSSSQSQYKVQSSSLDPSFLLSLMRELKPYTGDFLQRRGISRDTLDSHVFRDVFTTREYYHNGIKFTNTCVRLISDQGFQGISQRSYKPDGSSYKGIMGNKYGSIAVSKIDKTRPINHIYIGESMLDCAAHFDIHRLKDLSLSQDNILYISTEGNITTGQMELIKKVTEHYQIENIEKQVTYIFDNDSAGYRYAIKLNNFLLGKEFEAIDSLSDESLKSIISQLPNKQLAKLSDWNDDLMAMRREQSCSKCGDNTLLVP